MRQLINEYAFFRNGFRSLYFTGKITNKLQFFVFPAIIFPAVKKGVFSVLSLALILAFHNAYSAVPQYGDPNVAAERTEKYLPLLKGKNVGVVANQTSLVGETHLVDTLLSMGVEVKKIFGPEHGFRGTGDAGEHMESYTDKKTGLPVISIYGERMKPEPEDLDGLDIVLFDIQDVGVRFYTYISTMHYVMEACAENGVSFMVLDRPNPNGFYVDGPVLEMKHSSFVGMHPVPLVHGMTTGEYAKMINGEGWLRDGIEADLQVIRCKGYTHNTLYKLPVNPSPNLQTQLSVYLYPSLGLMEGTVMNVGRGTEFPFMVFGHPEFRDSDFAYTTRSIEGASTNPKHKGELCYGIDLRSYCKEQIISRGAVNLKWLLLARERVDTDEFFNSFFYRLSGNDKVKKMIKSGAGAAEIARSWEEEVEEFKKIRKKYLLYEDFE